MEGGRGGGGEGCVPLRQIGLEDGSSSPSRDDDHGWSCLLTLTPNPDGPFRETS